ncbi:MAG TPA: MoaD/ThiS family protein [Burkholderiaceae bacterium]|nr:MoaD/ThiS family protein [Burkholderiaceae bacterium]
MATGNEINVLYFAQVAEHTQKREERWPLKAPIQAKQWLAQLENRYPQLAPVNRLKIAINQQHAPVDSLIRPGDEVAVFEPVTGG